MPLGTVDYLFMALGGAIGLAGLWVFIFLRPKKLDFGPPGAEVVGKIEPPGRTDRRLTEPTRLTIALVLVITGYHLIVWRLPPAAVGVQLSRDYWYVWILIGITLMILSVALDRFEARSRGPKGGE
ncbi:MAG: hypothetical protein K2W85_17365 [Phycisphaerales bacterium]|nr:hypothetical protein [Phycisphaerales bacterium]